MRYAGLTTPAPTSATVVAPERYTQLPDIPALFALRYCFFSALRNVVFTPTRFPWFLQVYARVSLTHHARLSDILQLDQRACMLDACSER